MQPSILCVLVNWNLAEDTIECIQSLIAAGLPPYQIIIVDNGSTDDSVTRISKAFNPELIWIENKSNLGFVVACNQGIQKARELGGEWIFILNNDTIIDQTFFLAIQEAVQKETDYDLVGPTILDAQDPQKILFMGDKLIPLTLATYSIKRAEYSGNQYSPVIPVNFLNGCAMLVKAQVFREIGEFDESLFMYSEEVDFCWRAAQAGYQLGCIPRAKVWHKISKSANKVKKQTRFLKIRNQIIFYRKYARGIQRPIMFLFTIIRIIFIGIKDIFSLQAHLLPSLLTGWYNGWFVKSI